MSPNEQEVEAFAGFVSNSVKITRDLRQSIIDVLNKSGTSVPDGVVALLLIAAGNAKTTEMPKDAFVALCDILFEDVKLEDSKPQQMVN